MAKDKEPVEVPDDKPQFETDPDGNRVWGHSLKQKDMDRWLTRAAFIEPQYAKVGESIAVAVRLVKTGEEFKSEVSNGQVTSTEKIHHFKVEGIAFVPEDEVRDAVAYMALRILEEEEVRKNHGQQSFNFDAPDDDTDEVEGIDPESDDPTDLEDMPDGD